MKKTVTSLVVVVSAWVLQAQITITSVDMFNAPGQYYRAHVSTNALDVAQLIGHAGGPQAWDFANLPYDYDARFDYLDAKQTDYAALFPEAVLAERKTIEGTNKVTWLFFSIQSGKGRVVYGFYDPDFSPDMPAGVFDPPMIDFPERIKYGDSWSAATEFLTTIGVPETGGGGSITPGFGGLNIGRSVGFALEGEDFGIPAKVQYTVLESKADAYGFMTLPDRTFVECLRVNELSQYDILIDFDFSGNYQKVETYFVRTFYWLAKDRGIVAQITSQPSATPPPDTFATAFNVMVQFETNHPTGSHEPLPITDLRITPGRNQIMLHWTPPLNANQFRVEWTERLGPQAQWQTWTTTTNNFVIIPMDTPSKFFRVESLP